MFTVEIAIHSLPEEIFGLDRLLCSLKRNLVHCQKYLPLKGKVHLVFNVCLNLNLIDWLTSLIPLSFFTYKLKELEQLVHYPIDTHPNISTEINFMADVNNIIQGCNDHRRQIYKDSKSDYIIIIDPDIMMSDVILLKFLLAIVYLRQQNANYFVLTPQLTPIWDHTWDPFVVPSLLFSLVTKDMKNSLLERKKSYMIRDGYEFVYHQTSLLSSISLTTPFPKNQLKFSGGWVTCFPLAFARELGGVPDPLGSYGQDDFYLMLKATRHASLCPFFSVTQYILEGEIIIEDNKFNSSGTLKNFLTLKNPQHLQECKEKADRALRNCLNQ